MNNQRPERTHYLGGIIDITPQMRGSRPDYCPMYDDGEEGASWRTLYLGEDLDLIHRDMAVDCCPMYDDGEGGASVEDAELTITPYTAGRQAEGVR